PGAAENDRVQVADGSHSRTWPPRTRRRCPTCWGSRSCRAWPGHRATERTTHKRAGKEQLRAFSFRYPNDGTTAIRCERGTKLGLAGRTGPEKSMAEVA